MNPIASNSCRRFLLMMTAAFGIGVAAPAQTLTLADGQLLLPPTGDVVMGLQVGHDLLVVHLAPAGGVENGQPLGPRLAGGPRHCFV